MQSLLERIGRKVEVYYYYSGSQLGPKTRRQVFSGPLLYIWRW